MYFSANIEVKIYQTVEYHETCLKY